MQNLLELPLVGEGEGRLPRVVLLVGVRAVSEEDAHRGRVVGGDGEVQRGPTVLVLHVELLLGVQRVAQRLQGRSLAVDGGGHRRRAAVLGGRTQEAPARRPDDLAQDLRLVRSRCHHRRRLALGVPRRRQVHAPGHQRPERPDVPRPRRVQQRPLVLFPAPPSAARLEPGLGLGGGQAVSPVVRGGGARWRVQRKFHALICCGAGTRRGGGDTIATTAAQSGSGSGPSSSPPEDEEV